MLSSTRKNRVAFFIGHLCTLAGDSKFNFFEILKSNTTHEIMLWELKYVLHTNRKSGMRNRLVPFNLT